MGARGPKKRIKTKEERWTFKEVKKNFIITNEKAVYMDYMKNIKKIKPAILFDDLMELNPEFQSWRELNSAKLKQEFIGNDI